eukprot:CAMPEP_0194068208 /NCGR_PEP_ID=MMETSP0009_2-20130614/86971_1 /TAXON_ID=210454 /ORGANISM="Grammatophora oceanica, Strain CCMP 410" /LENGTH=82 /DNA_ID=CAMNT_0038721285 /DNA_START=90 /DNA_END=339 /DNA_ORIENTATION=+
MSEGSLPDAHDEDLLKELILSDRFADGGDASIEPEPRVELSEHETPKEKSRGFKPLWRRKSKQAKEASTHDDVVVAAATDVA